MVHQDRALARHAAAGVAQITGRHVHWQAVGRSGATLSTTNEMLVPQVDRPTDVAVAVLGVNDTIRLTALWKWRSGVRKLVSRLVNHGVGRVVFSSLPPVGNLTALPQPLRGILAIRARLLDHALRETIRELKGAVCGKTDFPRGADYVAADGFHPSALAYSEWGSQLANAIVATGFTK